MGYREIKTFQCVCEKCGTEWIPRAGKLPKVCPKCKSVKWNDKVTEKKESGKVWVYVHHKSGLCRIASEPIEDVMFDEVHSFEDKAHGLDQKFLLARFENKKSGKETLILSEEEIIFVRLFCLFMNSWNDPQVGKPTIGSLREDNSNSLLRVSNFGRLKTSEPVTEETVVDYTEFETP